MTFTTTARVSTPVRGLAKWIAIAAVAAVACLGAPRTAGAQQSRVTKLVEEASNHYDMLEMGTAKEKAKEALEVAEQNDVTGPPLARAHLLLGIIHHGADKDDQAALSSFKSALRADPSVEIPAVRATPALKKLMKQARESVDTSSSESGGGDSGSDRTLEEFTHEPIASARAGESMLIEARAPKDMPVQSVVFYFQRYNQDTWTEIRLDATDETRFATEVPGDKIYTSQIAYYLEAVDASGNTLATSGDRRNPHTVTVLGASSYDPETETTAQNEETGDGDETTTDRTSTEPTDEDGQDGDDGDDESSEETSSGSTPIAYFEIGGGTGGGFLTKYGDTSRPPPTANPGRELGAGFAPAFGHAILGMGGVLSETMTLGLYFRWQFSPSQNFGEIRSRNPVEDDRQLYSGFKNGECLGTGLPGDCLLGAKYRWFFSNGPKVQAFSTVGAGIGRIRHWVRLKEASSSDFCQNNDKTIHRPADQQNFCYRSDTARPGWMHFGLGGGITYEFNEVFALMGEAYVTILFPDTAVNLDLNVGPQFRF